MRDPDERMVYCLEAINHELHEMNKQLKIANKLSAMANVQNSDASDIAVRYAELLKALDLA